MKLLYIADGRSPIANNWISYFVQGGHEVHLASTFACKAVPGLASQNMISVAMSSRYGSLEIGSANPSLVRKIIPVGWRTKIRQLLAPWSLPRAAEALRSVIDRIQPDLIHAMRIPYEGMAAAMAVQRRSAGGGSWKKRPLLISAWGNDFTLHAKSSSRMKSLTSQALETCNGLHTDCLRDMRLAKELGFSSDRPAIVLPGGGGVKTDVFYPADEPDRVMAENVPVRVINPRGVRAYVRNETFFHAIPLVLDKYPAVNFLCPGMAGEAQAHNWIAELSIGDNGRLLPTQSQMEMAELFRKSLISVSITTHDGTPNTLLEGMACGCFPIAGDLESLREWIIPGENGLLVDPGDAKGLAEAIIQAISQPEMRLKARERNLQLVKERGEYGKTMKAAEEFYKLLIGGYS